MSCHRLSTQILRRFANINHSFCSELTAQPTKLEEFLIFFLHCQAMRIEKDLQMAAVLKVQDMYGMVSGWGHRLPYNDQVSDINDIEVMMIKDRFVRRISGFCSHTALVCDNSMTAPMCGLPSKPKSMH